MLERLKLASKSQILQLILKSAVLSLLLYFSVESWLATIAFIVLAIFFYFSPIVSWKEYIFSFLLTPIISLIFMAEAPFWGLEWVFLVSMVFGALFFMILGIKNFVFHNRKQIYNFLNSALFFAIFIAFFNSNKTDFYILKYLLGFLGIYLLFSELLGWYESFNKPIYSICSRKKLIAFSLSFLVSQYMWVTALLPLGFFNSSAFVLVLVVVLKDILDNYLSGYLNRDSVIKNITILVIFSLVIFVASKWQP